MKHRKISALLTVAALVLGCSTAAHAEATPETAVQPAQSGDVATETIPESQYSTGEYVGAKHSWVAPSEYNTTLSYVIKPDNTAAIVGCNTTNWNWEDRSLRTRAFFVPSSIDGHTVTEIGDYYSYVWDGRDQGAMDTYGFMWRTYYSEADPLQVIFPDTLTTISGKYFLPSPGQTFGDAIECVGSITIPNSVTSIAPFSFSEVHVSGNLTLSSGLKVIPEYAFLEITVTGDITIPDGVESIGDYAFASFRSGGNLSLGKSLKTIGQSAFSGSTLSGMVTLPDGLESIGARAFYACKITGIYIPASVTSIGEDAFLYSNPTIYGESGSYAEQYAKENEIPFVDKTAEISAFVERLYTVALDRASDADGKAYWVDKLKHNTATGSEVAFGFIASDEMKNRGLSDSEFVTVLYKTFFDREADEAGLKYWVDMLANGMSRDYVTCGFTGSTEFDTLCTSFGITRGSVSSSQARDKNANLTAFVNRLYVKLLDRSGEEDGLNHWCAAILDKNRTPQQVAQGFVFSDEFMNKNYSDEVFIEYMYRTFLGRDSEQAGKDYWLEQVSQGATREQLFEGFANSAEFAGIVASFGL